MKYEVKKLGRGYVIIINREDGTRNDYRFKNKAELIRRFFPKGTNFDKVTREQVKEAERWVNNYPRKLLGWKSAADLFEKEARAA